MSTRYRPAEVGGRPVRQLVEQTFKFSLGKSGGGTNITAQIVVKLS